MKLLPARLFLKLIRNNSFAYVFPIHWIHQRYNLEFLKNRAVKIVDFIIMGLFRATYSIKAWMVVWILKFKVKVLQYSKDKEVFAVSLLLLLHTRRWSRITNEFCMNKFASKIFRKRISKNKYFSIGILNNYL